MSKSLGQRLFEARKKKYNLSTTWVSLSQEIKEEFKIYARTADGKADLIHYTSLKVPIRYLNK